PTGPAPMTATWIIGRRSVLEGVPDFPVALRGPDARAVDPVELVPGALHVERHAVLEDREAGIARCELRMDRCERVLQRATGVTHLPRPAERRAQEGTRVLDRNVDVHSPNDGAATAHQLGGAVLAD